MAEDVRRITEEEMEGRRTFDAEGTAVEGDARAECLRLSEGLERSTVGGFVTWPSKPPAASYTVRNGRPSGTVLDEVATDALEVLRREEEGTLAVEGRTIIDPEPADAVSEPEETFRIPPTHGLRRIAQLWHFTCEDNFPFAK